MTQGELERLPEKLVRTFSELEIRIMSDIVRRIKENGFSTSSADWEITRLEQLGKSEKEIKIWIRNALSASDEEIERIFSDEVYEQYMGHARAYKASGMKQLPFDENVPLQRLIEATKEQISGEYENLAGSMGFAIRGPDGKIIYSPILEYYRTTMDASVIDIQSGAFSYQTVLERTINQMTTSGLRWIDYNSGVHSRVDVAARRAVLTGFRQVQGKINEQVAADLKTDYYEVTYHVGARPSHQPWQGKVWTMAQLQSVCGLGTVTGLHGANCYHDYNAFIPGVSVRTYTDEQLEKMIADENTPKEYLGKKYTTYEALQHQRQMETVMRKYRQDIKLLQDGGGTDDSIILKKAKYQGKLQEYEAFSKKMGLPMQKQRIYQDGLGKRISILDTEEIRKAKEKQELENQKRYAARREEWRKRQEQIQKDKQPEVSNEIVFDDSIKGEGWKESRDIILKLAGQYRTRLRKVYAGAKNAAGTIDMGGNLRLSSKDISAAIHEFAHSISIDEMTKFKVVDDSAFWKEIRKIRTKYRRDVGDDVNRWISSYEHSSGNVNEFFAEAFTQAKMKEFGFDIPEKYGKDFTYSQQVLDTVDRYFGKSVKKSLEPELRRRKRR